MHGTTANVGGQPPSWFPSAGPGGGSRLGACRTLATAGTPAPHCLRSVSSGLEVERADGLSADDCTDSL